MLTNSTIRPVLFTTLAGFALACTPSATLRAAGGKLELVVVDAESGLPVPCRIHLKNAAGKPQRVRGLPFFHDHFVFPGKVTLRLPRGTYRFELERGKEYPIQTGHFVINDHADDKKRVEMRRFIDMSSKGWWSGDLHIHRPIEDIELLMQADDLHVAPVITWWNNKNEWQRKQPPEVPLVRFDTDRYYHLLAGEDEREGGALLFFNLRRPLDIATKNREYPSPMQFIAEARRQPDAWIDIEKPFWWDVPLWLASGQVDSIGLANNHMQREKMYVSEAWGKPRDTARLKPPLGNGRWSQEIYYHILNCGLRIPPSAGSASGVLHNPLGYNRAYVFVGEEFTYENWWEGLKAGRVMVTNGPLLLPLVAGKLPGHVFKSPSGNELNLDAVLNLSTRDPISYLEVVQNGELMLTVRLEEWAKTGRLPALNFKESGWFLIRAITELDNTFRFASTGPYYVEIGDSPRRISRASVQFFLDWVDERIGRVKLEDPQQRKEVLQYHQLAREYWEDLSSRATAP